MGLSYNNEKMYVFFSGKVAIRYILFVNYARSFFFVDSPTCLQKKQW